MASTNGLPPLYLAAMNGDLRSVKHRLALGDNVNATLLTGGTNYTPIMVAVAGGYTDVVKALIDAGADISPPPPSNLMMGASAVGYNEIVQLLLRAGANPDVDDSKDGRGPLHLAAKRGNDQLIAILISGGATVDRAAHDGTTSLMLASFEGRTECGRLLLTAGANPLKQNKEGFDSCFFAAQTGFADVLELFIRSGAAGNLNRLNPKGASLLMAATSNEHLAVVKLLLRFEADPFTLGGGSMTAFLLANDLPVFKALLEGNESRAATFVDPYKGNTLFHQVVAVGARRPSAFLCLLSKAGVNPLVRNKDGETAAEVARRMGQLDNAKLLDFLEAKYREKESSGTKDSALTISTCAGAAKANDESKAFTVQSSTHENVEESKKISCRDEEVVTEAVESISKVKTPIMQSNVDEKALESLSISDCNEGAKVSADVSQDAAEVEKQHKKVRPCLHCQNPTHRRCSRCRCTFVCSRDCQMATMASHKPACLEMYEERQARKAAAGV